MPSRGRTKTYNDGIDKCAPAAFVLEQGQDEGHGSGAKEDEDELILELLEDELPERRRRLFSNSLTVSVSIPGPGALRQDANLPFLPYFSVAFLTCASVRPAEACTPKVDKTWSTGLAKAFSIFRGVGRLESRPSSVSFLAQGTVAGTVAGTGVGGYEISVLVRDAREEITGCPRRRTDAAV